MSLFNKKSGEEPDRGEVSEKRQNRQRGASAGRRPDGKTTGVRSFRDAYELGFRTKTVEEIAIEKRRLERSTRKLDELNREFLSEDVEADPISKIEAAKDILDSVTEKAGRKVKKTIKEKIRKESTRASRIAFWAIALTVTLLFSFALSRMFFRMGQVQEGSMTPTLTAGDTYLIDSVAYKVFKPSRGDVIAFRSGDLTDSLHIKRVIGLPGDTIQIKKGKIYINGSEYEEKGDFAEIVDAGLATEPVKLDPGDYFVLGDNRNGSEDSRYSGIGNVSINAIEGKVWFRIFPIRKIRFV
uniref:signal peptidase I n=1 Tax=Eubacterium cellulosolvens TaxID=29322 RepID=UPI0009DF30CC|nr:signal peptidase I [[Eubacterium] cellulosolvens]